jgi:predicted nucleic acid-binding protein
MRERGFGAARALGERRSRIPLPPPPACQVAATTLITGAATVHFDSLFRLLSRKQ